MSYHLYSVHMDFSSNFFNIISMKNRMIYKGIEYELICWLFNKFTRSNVTEHHIKWAIRNIKHTHIHPEVITGELESLK